MKLKNRTGDVRIIKKFLFFPKKLGTSRRWLSSEIYIQYYDHSKWTDYYKWYDEAEHDIMEDLKNKCKYYLSYNIYLDQDTIVKAPTYIREDINTCCRIYYNNIEAEDQETPIGRLKKIFKAMESL